MMRALLDGREIDVADGTMRTALAAAREAADALGRVIVEAELDGQPISNEELAEPSAVPGAGREVRFVSAEPRALVRTTLLEIADLMPRVREAQLAAASDLQVGRMQPAFGHLQEAVGIWDALRRAVQEGPALLGIGLEQFLVGRPGPGAPDQGAGTARQGACEPIVGHVGRLSDLLADLKAAIQAQDWSSLADLLEGELADAAERWESILRDMAAHIAQRR